MSKTDTPTTRGSNRRSEADVPSAPPETHQAAGIALRAGSEETTLQYLPLRCLRLDERNVRKDEPTEAEIDELADLIDVQGLLQTSRFWPTTSRVVAKGATASGCTRMA